LVLCIIGVFVLFTALAGQNVHRRCLSTATVAVSQVIIIIIIVHEFHHDASLETKL